MVKVYVLLTLTAHNSVLLLKRQNVDFGNDLYSLPGGECEQNETPTNALIRETKEELGISLNPSDIKLVHTLSRNGTENNLLLLVFKADTWSGNITLNEPLKHSEYFWAPINNIPSNTIPAHQQALTAIRDNKTYSEHGW